MALIAGARLGPYEIQSPLGTGERSIARSIRCFNALSPSRFLPFIFPQTLRPLNDSIAKRARSLPEPYKHLHPLQPGYQNGVDYLVMECLEGETAVSRLDKGRLPPIKYSSMELGFARDSKWLIVSAWS